MTARDTAGRIQRGGRALAALRGWFDTSATGQDARTGDDDRIDWLRAIPFIGMHLACLAVFAVGVRLEDDDRLTVHAPFGLEDLFAMRLRPNPSRATGGFLRTAQAAQRRWPELAILEA